MKKISTKALITLVAVLSAIVLCVVLYFLIKIPVPSVEGAVSEEGINALRKHTFIVKVEEEYHDTVPKGSVISQDRVFGEKLRILSTVNVKVSKGIEHFEVPDVLKKPVLEAKEALEKLKFKVKVTEISNPSFLKGVVISQSLTKGKSMPKGTEIELIVNTGGEKVKVPNITGKTLEQAQKEFQNAGLILKTVVKCSNSVKDGYIISQEVKGGEKAYRNAVIYAQVSAGVANTVGNTPANSNQGGYVAVQGEWVYYTYSAYDSSWLYKMKTDGSAKQRVTQDVYCGLNVVGEWIYYANIYGFDQGIYKVRLDGTDKTKLSSDYSSFVHVQGDWIYTQGNWGIYRMKTDGSQKKLICSDNCLKINIVGDLIYYVNDDGLIYKIRTDGSEKTKLKNEFTLFDFAVDGDTIFGSKADIYCKMRIDGSGFVNYGDDINKETGQFLMKVNLNAADGWLYFLQYEYHNKQYSNSAIYKIKADKSQKTKIADVKYHGKFFICVVDDWIYFEDGEDDYMMYRVKTDGTKLERV